MTTDSSMSELHSVADAVIALGDGLLAMFPQSRDTPFVQLIKQVPPGHELHALYSRFRRCMCGRTGTVSGVVLAHVEGEKYAPCCPDCDRTGTLELLPEATA